MYLPITNLPQMIHSLARWLGLAEKRSNPPPPFATEWQQYLERYVWQYLHLGIHHRRRIEDVVAHMVAERRWTGGNNFQITEEMLVGVAGNVALMTLGIDEPYYFPHVPEIILYPKGFFVTDQQSALWTTDPILGGQVNQPRIGEAWQSGPIVLAWDRVVSPYNDDGWYVNVVIHEFTHHLDGLDGDMEGTPPLTDRELEHEWYRVTELDYLHLVGQARRGEQGILDHYGATNRAEFFAVAAESFFNHPHDLRDQHPHLYQVLAQFFRQSPADFLPRDAQPPLRLGAEKPKVEYQLQPALAGDAFMRGLSAYQEGENSQAIQAFTEALVNEPNDEEIYAARALAYFHDGQFESAVADADKALEIDPEDGDAPIVRACSLVRLEKYSQALAELKQLARDTESGMVHSHLGLAYLHENQLKKAIHHLSIAKAMDPSDAQTYRWRAAAYGASGDEELAQRDALKADRLDPGGDD